jgi:hypothetical protein
MGPAVRASHRLRVKPSIARLQKFFPAISTQRELVHCRIVALERHRADYCVARSTLGAARERIVVSTVAPLSDFVQTLWANGPILRHAGDQRPVAGFRDDGKTGATGRLNRHGFDLRQSGSRRQYVGQRRFERLEHTTRPFDFNFHAARRIADCASQSDFRGQPKDGRPHAKPLHATG